VVEKFDMLASAVLIWLPEGEVPDKQRFDFGKVSAPPSANPEPWWLLHEAITYAMTAERKHAKVPWIKTGMEMLPPQEIAFVFKNMGDLTGFGSDAPAVRSR
jgi:hypothetical protein